MRVLFVCLGNICRSPMAEALLRQEVLRRGLEGFWIDSAGTSGFHEGDLADPRTVATLRRHGVPCEVRSRPVVASDFVDFDRILAMDRSNLAWLHARCPPAHHHRLALVRAPVGGGDVPDPWSGGPEGFEEVRELLVEALTAWLAAWAPDPTGRTSPG